MQAIASTTTAASALPQPGLRQETVVSKAGLSRSGLVAVGLLALTGTLFLYRDVWSEWFYGDDFWFLLGAKETSWPDWIWQAADPRSWEPVPLFQEYRPVYLLFFKAEFQLFGLHALGYHLTNLALHIATSAMVGYFALRLSRDRIHAVAAAAVFALHPAFGGAVSWAVNGNSLLAAFLLALSLHLFLSYVDRPASVTDWQARSLYVLLLAVITATLYTHPATLTMLAGFAAVLLWRRLEGAGGRLSIASGAGIVLVFAAAGLVHYLAGEHSSSASAGVVLGSHLPDNYWTLLGLITVPFSEASAPGWSTYLTLALFGAGVALSVRRAGTMLLAGWVALSLVPPASLLLGGFARLLYLPGVGLALVAGDLAASGYVRAARWLEGQAGRRLQPWFAVAVLIALLLPWSLAARGSLRAETMPGPERQIGRQGSSNREMVGQLRTQYPTLPRGAILYVAGPPGNLVLFGDDALVSLIGLYYPGVEFRAMSIDGLRSLSGPAPGVFFFVYQPSGQGR